MPKDGDLKACTRCGQMSAVFDSRTHSRLAAFVGEGGQLPMPRIGPGWTCRECSHIEEEGPADA